MSHHSDLDDKALIWAKEEIDKVVREITERGAIEGLLIEARPIWARPSDIVIGQLRDQGVETQFLWIIGGSVPIDYISSEVAATPRDAARHFSMKWQLEAARHENPAERRRLGLSSDVDWESRSKTLIAKAEYLNTFVIDDQFWP